MGRKMRLELTTSGTTNQRSNQLSYIRHLNERIIFTRFLLKSQVKNHLINFPARWEVAPKKFLFDLLYHLEYVRVIHKKRKFLR